MKHALFLLLDILVYGLIMENASNQSFSLKPVWSFWPMAIYGIASIVLLLMFGFTENSDDAKSDDSV